MAEQVERHEGHGGTDAPLAPAPMARPDDGPPRAPLPAIAELPASAPFGWWRRGWEDLVATRFVGVFYGAVFVAMGYLIAWVYATRWQLTMGLIGGFFLMGPFVCAGLYELSRRRARGEPAALLASMLCWRRNPGAIALFALLLAFLMIVWARTSVLLFALVSTTDFATLEGLLGAIVSLDNAGFVLLWLAVGFAFASLVFAVGVVSVPMLLDRDVDAVAAVLTSVRTVLANPRALYLWAATVVLVVGASLALGFLPLLLTAPLVGHATWHAYAELLGADG